MITVSMDIDGVVHKMDTLAQRADDLEKPLRVFGGYLKKKAKRKYDEQNFQPLAESTVEKRTESARRTLERKLHRDYRRAVKRAGGGEGIISEVIGQQGRGARNRLAVLAEFQRRHGLRRSSLTRSADLKPLTLKQTASLDARTGRALAKAAGRPILGRLSKSLLVEVRHGAVTLASRTKGGWSEVHNAGGSAGHGASIPKRETVAVDATDLQVFVAILKSYFLLPFEEGLHGPGF
jgi:phage gpG-like protein